MRLHVAVVDDDDVYLRAVQRSIGRRRSDYHLSFLRSGDELVAHARVEPPALVVMDVHMPGTDGIATCERLKRDPATRGVTIVLASAQMCRELAETALGAGADRVVVKPYDVATVAAAVLAPRIPNHTQTLERVRDHLAVTRTLAGKLGLRVRPFITADDVDALAFLALCAAALQYDEACGEEFRWYADRRVRETIDQELARFGARSPQRLDQIRRSAAAQWELVCAGVDPSTCTLSE
ncbi:MAG TPA: response regulator [Kofleriaceae bacterium]|jgi:CheY-like chemotaxis protein